MMSLVCSLQGACFSSVANLTVPEQSSQRVLISFWQFARVGIVVTLLTTLLEIGILVLEHKLFPGT